MSKGLGEIDIMQKWLLGAALAAFVLGISGSGVGLMAASNGVGPPDNLPPNPQQDTPPWRADKPSLADVRQSNENASNRAVLRTAEVSPVFGAASPASI